MALSIISNKAMFDLMYLIYLNHDNLPSDVDKDLFDSD